MSVPFPADFTANFLKPLIGAVSKSACSKVEMVQLANAIYRTPEMQIDERELADIIRKSETRTLEFVNNFTDLLCLGLEAPLANALANEKSPMKTTIKRLFNIRFNSSDPDYPQDQQGVLQLFFYKN